jgi:hypothetical protein
MSSQMPFSLRIFLADGDPDGLRLVERSNWIGKAVMFPRALYTKIRTREEFQQTGVYLLIGSRPDSDSQLLYVGEGDPVRPRIDNHHANKDFWTHAVFFVAGTGQLNKAHIQYLEAQLVRRAAEAKRAELENGNRPAEPTLSEADRADMIVFLQNILGMLPVMGIDAFEHSAVPITGNDGETIILTCQGKGVIATGYESPQGFVVRVGSQANAAATAEDYFANVRELRADLIKNGVLAATAGYLSFTQDYTFRSPSLASCVVLGRASNGRTEWRVPGGKTLKEIQTEQAKV